MGTAQPDLPLEAFGERMTQWDIGPVIDGLLAHDELQPSAWQHQSAREFVFALAKVADDLDVLVGPEVAARPSWRLFAYMLAAARDYDHA